MCQCAKRGSRTGVRGAEECSLGKGGHSRVCESKKGWKHHGQVASPEKMGESKKINQVGESQETTQRNRALRRKRENWIIWMKI